MNQTSSSKERPVLVTAALIRDKDRILIAQRKADSSVEPSKWEFPGGKVEYGEHPEDCLIREIREELDLEIEVESLFDVTSHVYPLASGRLHIVLLCYFCRTKSGELKKLDVQDAIWVQPLQLREFTYAAADIPVVEKFLRLQGLVEGS